MGIQQFELIGIPVTDQERAKAFYRDTLGFTIQIDAAFEGEMRWVQLSPPGGGMSCALMNWDPSFAPGSIKELYLVCDDIRATYQELQGKGVQFSDEPFDSPFGMFAHFQDPDGNGLVLHQPPAGAP